MGEQKQKPYVAILYTPASLAGGHEPGDELARVDADARVIEPNVRKRLSKDMVKELAASGWLRQARWRRGGFFTTSGLRVAFGTPELAMLNVPGPFAPCANALLDRLVDLLIDREGGVLPGEVVVVEDPRFEMAVTLDLIMPGEIGFPEFGLPMLALVLLP